jgi:uncharacterized protein YprB with RNaseH-like and TPR domain
MPDFAKALLALKPQAPPQARLFQDENPVTSLARQLGFLKARSGATREPELSELDVLPHGKEESTPFGTHYVTRRVYGGGHHHGQVRLDRFSCLDLSRLMGIMRQKGSVPDRDRIVFLDTETTGMQGGVGTCPFLVGLGFFEGDDFHMVQYFIRDFDEEFSMLYALSGLLDRFRLVVTYNGASFDVPLLESRLTLARQVSPFAEMSHLDLLTSARRLWRNSCGSCRLTALEHRVVSFLRGPDVPGAMIPRAYFDFLRGKPGSVLRAVFTHNIHDVISLAALTVYACDRVTCEPAAFDEPLDLYSLARVLETTGEWHRSILLYDMALSGGLPADFQQKAEENLALACRRAGEHERALALCCKLMDRPVFSMQGYEGAAIHYERVARDPSRALQVVEAAMERLREVPEARRWRASLASRRERLRQKVIQF